MSKKTLFLFAAAVLAASPSLGVELTYKIDFSSTEPRITSDQEYHFAHVAGCDLTGEVGEPQLPVRLVHILLPPGSQVKGVEIIQSKEDKLSGEFLVHPAQPPEILPMPGVELKRKAFVEPKASVYSSPNRHPGKVVELAGCGNVGGYRIASFLLYPLQYIPKERELIFHPQIEFRVELKDGRPSPWRRSGTLGEVVRALVLNPEDVTPRPILQPGECQYVIITSSSLQTAFQPLADWKTEKGVPARVVTTDSIYLSCPGRDNAEKVRNFIKDAHLSWGTEWVLLGGDTDVVPDRVAYAMTSGAGFYPDEDSIRADLYFSDLDGTWDFNNNDIFGEVADSVDLYPDVIVGRSPVNTVAEVQTFVGKILTYEKSPPTDYQLSMLFLAEILWPDPYTDSGIAKNRIDSLYVPLRFDPIEKLYESLGNENYTTVMAALNAGQNMTNHNGHANQYVMGIGGDYLWPGDMDALVNGARQGLMYSIGCWPAAFDYDCIGEHWVNNPNGGGIAFIGNSRYGWGSPGNPEFGYSDRFDQIFYDKLFLGNVYRMGATLALGKAHYIPKSRVANVYRWHQYQINLLGEPELPIWTNIPGTLLVSFPDSIPVGTVQFSVTVREGGEPVERALVCLLKGNEIYSSGHTGINGQVAFEVSPISAGELRITATAHDFFPYQDSCSVFSDGPWVGYLSHAITGGNGDNEVNPGETLGMSVTLKNFGNLTADNVSGLLRTTDSLLTLTDSLQSFGTLDPGDTATSSGEYVFSVSPDASNGHIIYLTLYIQDGSGNTWESILGIPVATPVLQFVGYLVDDTTGGNGNGVPEPGEDFAFSLWIENTGLGLARDVTGMLSTVDPYLTVTGAGASFGSIPPGARRAGVCSLEVDPGCPTPHFADLTLQTTTGDGYLFNHPIILTLGPTGFLDDVESGPGGWSHGGTGDLWHITTHRCYSETHSWYCGRDTTWSYEDNMNCYLMTPPIVLAPNSTLSFWGWYDVATYGVDGLYVEIMRGGGSDTLDFIGSGGALLPDKSMGNPWLEETYDLSYIPYGETIQVRFSFVSDASDVAEGFYLDDISVAGVVLGTEEECQLPPPEQIGFFPIRPNPFGGETEIWYALPKNERVAISVYDAGGRLVRTLLDGLKTPGYHRIVWEGKDRNGENVASGVYFCLLRVGDFTQAKKMVLVK